MFMMILLNIGVVMVVGPGAWWLTGYDSNLAGDGRRSDFWRRFLRVITTLLLLEVMFLIPPTVLVLSVLLGVIWAGCGSEFFSRWFHRLLDPGFHDKREFDPTKSARDLDRVADLLKSGRHEEAVQLCEELKKSGDANVMVLETLLARAGVQQEPLKKTNPLVEANHLRVQGKFAGAETILKSLLAANPANVDAALMLMRLYAQNMRRADKAAEILRSLQTQPDIPHATVEYAAGSIHEWSQTKPEPVADVLPDSVDELLARGYLGTAIETLENKVKEQPQDFDSWLKLAEAHGLHSGNIQRAEKIVRKIEGDRAFTAEQIGLAKARLAEWRESGLQGKSV
jgi:tetratricopeptide (TPR) repeat protein